LPPHCASKARWKSWKWRSVLSDSYITPNLRGLPFSVPAAWSAGLPTRSLQRYSAVSRSLRVPLIWYDQKYGEALSRSGSGNGFSE
jgi:hypothetical protein